MLCKKCKHECHHDLSGEHKMITGCDCEKCDCGVVQENKHWMLWNIYHSILAFLLGCLVIIELIELIKNW